MKENKSTQIKAGHIITAIIVFTVFIYILGTQNQSKPLLSENENSLIELDKDSFFDSITLKKCFVLFYVEDSELCDNMSANLSKLAKDNQEKTGFYKLNLDKYPEYDLKYNISGVPNIFLFNEGVEVARIMGIVPEQNLEKIYDRTFN
ncbi:MAG: thioredoxin domain-containing protein [Dysgonomonas sp.]|nr:thioredoxin domain-containing protein [Dysgonomonas sp.]